jgi:hypothetical protein
MRKNNENVKKRGRFIMAKKKYYEEATKHNF